MISGSSDQFYVRRVIVESENEARYVLNHANVLIRPDTLTTEKKINCMVATLKESGLFREINTKLIPSQNEYDLIITPIYTNDLQDLIVSEIVLDPDFNIDRDLFLNRVRDKLVFSGMEFLQRPFIDIENDISETIEELDKTKNQDDLEIWVRVQKINSRTIKIYVDSQYPKCE